MPAHASHRRTLSGRKRPHRVGVCASAAGLAGASGLAIVLAVAVCGSAMLLGGATAPPQSTSASHASAKPPVPLVRSARKQPRRAEGYISSYVNVRAAIGVEPMQINGGAWTFQRMAAQGKGRAIIGEAPLAQDERNLRDTLQQHQVTSVAHFYGRPFKRADLAQQYGLDRAYVLHVAPGADVRALQTALTKFPALLERVELDSHGSIAEIPNDPSFNQQWDMHNSGQVIAGSGGIADADIDGPEAWDLHTGSASTIIAVLDTGVQADHPDLLNRVIAGVATYGIEDPPGNYELDTSDIHGHGTHCSGIAAAQGDNSVGVAGVNWNAKILAMRVTNQIGDSNQTDVSEAVVYAADHHADVISLSLQFFVAPNTLLEDACAYAYDSGALPIAASGNNGSAIVAWPAAYLKCMAVGATTNTDVRWASSSYGPEMDVVAPGANIFGLWRNSGYTVDGIPLQSGTSMAAPHVAGLAALLRSHNPALSVWQIEQIIKHAADDKGPPGWDEEYGWGRINVRAALEATAISCEGDVDSSGAVNVDDMLAVITSWGRCPALPATCPADVAPRGAPPGNGIVDVDDLLSVITRWGACP